MPGQTRNELEHFFARYKDLEPGKWVKVEGWDGREAAEQLVVEAIQRLEETGGH